MTTFLIEQKFFAPLNVFSQTLFDLVDCAPRQLSSRRSTQLVYTSSREELPRMTQIAWCGLGMQQAALEQPIHPGELNLFYFVPADQRPVASLHGAIDTSIWKPTNVIAAMIYGSHSCKGFWGDVVLRDAQSLLQHGTPMHEPRLTPREALKDVTRMIAFIKGNSRVDL